MSKGRPSPTPITKLGSAMRTKRGAVPAKVACIEAGLSLPVYYRFERGSQEVGRRAGRLLAAWLGWTVGEVIDASERPVEEPTPAE